jgi:hypothetical protein
MPNTTNHSIYYPDSSTSISPLETVFAVAASSVETALNDITDVTDELRTDVDAKAIAEDLPFKMAAGTGSNETGLAVNATHTYTEVAFPLGRFTYPPIMVGSTSSQRYTISFSAITANDCTITVRNVSDATGTGYTYQWQAVQMLSTGAAG